MDHQSLVLCPFLSLFPSLASSFPTYLQVQHCQPRRLLTPIVIPPLTPHALIPTRTEGLVAFPCERV